MRYNKNESCAFRFTPVNKRLWDKRKSWSRQDESLVNLTFATWMWWERSLNNEFDNKDKITIVHALVNVNRAFVGVILYLLLLVCTYQFLTRRCL